MTPGDKSDDKGVTTAPPQPKPRPPKPKAPGFVTIRGKRLKKAESKVGKKALSKKRNKKQSQPRKKHTIKKRSKKS